MSKNSSIEWTESTWNPITGCSKISPGCKNCYAERMAKRLKAMGQTNYRNGFKVTTHPLATELPVKWKKPQTIFVNSMSDIFHEFVEKAFIFKLFDVMNRADWHLYQILTKRSDRGSGLLLTHVSVKSEISMECWHFWGGIGRRLLRILHESFYQWQVIYEIGVINSR